MMWSFKVLWIPILNYLSNNYGALAFILSQPNQHTLSSLLLLFDKTKKITFTTGSGNGSSTGTGTGTTCSTFTFSSFHTHLNSVNYNSNNSNRNNNIIINNYHHHNQKNNAKYRNRNIMPSELSVLPNDDQFYDGYEEFIRNLQQDLENDSFDIYYDTTTTNNNNNNNKSNQRQEDDHNERQSKKGIITTRNTKRNFSPKPTSSYSTTTTTTTNATSLPTYKRDKNDNPKIFSSTEYKTITLLIKERSIAQREKNYQKADDILKELNNVHGVYVWDRDKLWSVSALAPSRRYRNDGSKGNKSSFNHNKNNYNNNNNNNNNNSYLHTNRFGSNGHDYTQIGNEINKDVCPLELHEIHDLLSKRLEYKLLKQYHKADRILSQLYKNGVRVHDKLKQWRCDGGIFEDIEGILADREYTMNEFSDVVDDEMIVAEIEDLVREWGMMKKKCNFYKADRIREVLWDNYRVAVDDKSRSWSYGGDFGPDGTFRWTDDGPINPRRKSNRDVQDWRKVGMYTKSAHSEPLYDNNDEEEVWNLIHDRLEARRVKDFDLADLIRDHLYKEYRVSVDDQLRQWSVGGAFDDASTQSLRSGSPTTADGKTASSFVKVYNQRGGNGHLSEKEILLVKEMIKRRAEEISRYNLKAAESIRQGLKRKFYVMIDDANNEWHVRGNDFIMNPKLKVIPKPVEASMGEIEALIRERNQAKVEGDYQRADEIRDDLFNMYNIILDDRLKEWSIKENHMNEDDNSEELSEELSSLTVAQLKEKLKAAGLPVSGKKAELIDRLSQPWLTKK